MQKAEYMPRGTRPRAGVMCACGKPQKGYGHTWRPLLPTSGHAVCGHRCIDLCSWAEVEGNSLTAGLLPPPQTALVPRPC
eukprot:357853-Chlamydomonas_euryale.AAC.1